MYIAFWELFPFLLLCLSLPTFFAAVLPQSHTLHYTSRVHGSLVSIVCIYFFIQYNWIYNCIRNSHSSLLFLFAYPLSRLVRFGGGASEKEFWTRTLGFTFLTVVGIVPNIHLTLITPSSWLSLQPYILAMFTSYGTGLFFYVSKVPEVVLPSFVNRTFFTSHVMWHFGVIAGITVWGVALLKAQSLMRSETCDSWDL